MYLKTDENGVVCELIPDTDPELPGIPIEERYPQEFVAQLQHVPDETNVTQGCKFNQDTGEWEYVGFSYPPTPEPAPEEPDIWDELNAAYQEGVDSV